MCGIFTRNQSDEFYFGDYSKMHLFCSFIGMPFLPIFLNQMQREFGIIRSTVMAVLFPPSVICYPMDHKKHGKRITLTKLWHKFGAFAIAMLLFLIFLVLTATVEGNTTKGAMLIMAMMFFVPSCCFIYWITSDDYKIRQRKIELGYIEPYSWQTFRIHLHYFLIGTSLEEEWMRTHEHYNTKDYKGHWKPKWNKAKYRKDWLCEDFHLLVKGDENPRFFRVDEDVILQAAREEEHIRFGDIVSTALGGHGFSETGDGLRKGKVINKHTRLGRHYHNPHVDEHRSNTTAAAAHIHGLNHHDADHGDIVLHMRKMDINTAAHAWHIHAHEKHHLEHQKRMDLIKHYHEDGIPDHLKDLNDKHKQHFADHQDHYHEDHLEQYISKAVKANQVGPIDMIDV